MRRPRRSAPAIASGTGGQVLGSHPVTQLGSPALAFRCICCVTQLQAGCICK